MRVTIVLISPCAPGMSSSFSLTSPGLQDQPVDPLENVGVLLRHEGVIGLADQALVRMPHELAHGCVQHHETQLVVLDEDRMRDGVENPAQGIEILQRQRLHDFFDSDVRPHTHFPAFFNRQQ